MPDAKLNETCIIGLPTCGYAFSSARMAFIAAPADGAHLELDVIDSVLREREYESSVALRQLDPGRLAFCTKICSKIITSQFCIVLLNATPHAAHPDLLVANPNVHLEYGLMLAFKKHVIPMQKEGGALAFNVRPLDTVHYTDATFRERLIAAVDDAIARVGTPARPTRSIASNEALQRYLAAKGLTLSDVAFGDYTYWYRIGQPMGFNLLDSPSTLLYFGVFDTESAKEVAFRLTMFLRSLHNAREQFKEAKGMTLDQEQSIWRLWDRVSIEVLVANDVDRDKIEQRVRELTADLHQFPWRLLRQSDVESHVAEEYSRLDDL